MIAIARLFGSLRFFKGLSVVLAGRVFRVADRHFRTPLGQGRAKLFGGGAEFLDKCLIVSGLPWIMGRVSVDGWRGLASERQKRALGSARVTQVNSDGSTGQEPRS